MKQLNSLIFVFFVVLSTINIVNSGNGDNKTNSEKFGDTTLASMNPNLLTSELELSISAESVGDESTSVHPICVIYIQNSGNSKWIEYGRTEVVANNRNPVFKTKISIQHRFYENQPLKLQIYNIDPNEADTPIRLHNSIGFSVIFLSQLIASGRKSKIHTYTNQDEKGTTRTYDMFIFVVVTEKQDSKEQVVLELETEKLSKQWTKLLRDLRPYIQIHREAEEQDKSLFIYRTEVLGKTDNNFRWRRFVIPRKILFDKDERRPLKFTVWNWHSSKKPYLIGECKISSEELLRSEEKKFTLQCPDNNILARNNCGYVQITSFQILDQSLIQHMISGTKLRTLIGIDFSSQNHEFRGHYKGQSKPGNDYKTTITSIVPILEKYDLQKRITVYGYPSNLLTANGSYLYHKPGPMFYVNSSKKDLFCTGVDDVLKAYNEFIEDAQLHYDANPAPVIKAATNLAEKEPTHYHILILLTTGYFYYPKEYCADTLEAIKRASASPLSIIIIGIGFMEFPLLEELIRTANEQLDRDILTFLIFKKFSNQNLLAKEALSKIPQQVMSYMMMKNHKPDSTTNNESPDNNDKN